MAGDNWQLAPEVVAEAAGARVRERKRVSTVFVAGAAMLGFLVLFMFWAFIASVSVLADGVRVLIFVFGGMMMVAIIFAARARAEMQRMKRVVAATSDAKISWFLTEQRIVASLDGVPHHDLAFPI